MFLHFYTDFDNIQRIENGDKAIVWNRGEAERDDIHISIDTNMYIIYRNDDQYYEVQKMTWREPTIQKRNMASNFY